MTREEAIGVLSELAGYEKIMDLIQNHSVSVQDALYIAIKALEQEPCEDAISRQTVLDILKHAKENGIVRITVPYLERTIESLPSITPKAESEE